MGAQPAIGTTEIPGLGPLIEMDCMSLSVTDPNGIPSPLVIDPGDSFKLSTEFRIRGLIWPIVLSILGPAAAFELEYFAETIGPGTDLSLGTVTINGFTTADADINFPRVASPDETTLDATIAASGTYKLTVVVRTVLHPLLGFATGFFEGPIIQQR